VSNFLNDFELDALKHQLARDPFAGSGVPGLAPLMRIDFAGSTVIYAVNPEAKLIALVQIGAGIGKPVEVEEGAKSKLKELSGLLIKGGFMGLGKQAMEWLIEFLKHWWH
jgi:hypothetical protein